MEAQNDTNRLVAAAAFLDEMSSHPLSGVVVETDNYVFFWKPPSPFDQWTPCKFEAEGVVYNCAEQWMMAEKARLFGDTEVRRQILNEYHPRKQKQLGQRVRGFNHALWDSHRFDIVLTGNRLKFQQNFELLSQLRATSDKILVEASPQDRIWGIGLDAENAQRTPQEKWPGMNLLGQVLMSVRRELGDCNFTVKVDAGNVQQGEEVVCRQIEEWLQGCCPSAGAPHFCDKGALQVELSAAQQNLKKSERRKLSAEFETRRQVMEARMKELAAISLPTIFGSFFSIFSRDRKSVV